MTLTRSGFLRAMLGAIGLGQSATLQGSRATLSPGKDYTIKAMLTEEGPKLIPGTHGDWVEEPPCKPDEERCPLSHCQKPAIKRIIEMDDDPYTPTQFVNIGNPFKVCSVCGIVYVPVKEKP